MKCFYHSADLDGKCSGAIVKMAFPECEMIGINYGELFPWGKIEPNEVVFMVDFSLQPFENMERLNKLCTLHWIDHHESAIKEAQLRGFVARGKYSYCQIGNRAGCELTWISLFNPENIPLVIKLLSCYDTWTWQGVPGAQELQYGLSAYSIHCHPEDSVWKNLFSPKPLSEKLLRDLIAKGGLILNYIIAKNIEYGDRYAFETRLGGLTFIAMNRGACNSEAFCIAYDPEKHDAMLAFNYTPHAKSWTVSLYSDKSYIDVSAIAKKYGGGGHRGAAGFQCKELPFKLFTEQ